MTIQLEPWGEGDLALLQALLGDPAMMEHLGGPEAPEKIAERQGRYVGNPGSLKILVDGAEAGWVGFWEHEWRGEPIYEMGWSVLPGFQGRGVASEATRLALEAARASDGPRSVHAFPPPDNGASNAVCRNTGFELLARSSSSSRRACSRRATTGVRAQPLKRRRRRALATTLTLESAIAAPAMTGLSRPTAASGIAATL